MFRAFMELNSLYEAIEEGKRWEFIGKVEYFNRLTCRIESIEVKRPIYVNGVSKKQALNNAKYIIRKEHELPENTVLTPLEYSIKEVSVKIPPEYCPDCKAELNDAHECPRCNPDFGLGDIYDGEELN
jgi:hypothetical protein